MKKTSIILLSLLIILLILCFLSCNNNDDLQLIEETSYFSDYYIEGEKVYIQCEITIENHSADDKTFKINAIFNDDVELGLLKNANLKGYNQEITNDEFKIEKGSTLTTSVTFVGDFAGTNKKHDRNLPEIIINNV